MQSERKLLEQLAPELSEDLILRLVAAFHDLRHAYEAGILTYPYSLRGMYELLCGKMTLRVDLFCLEQS